MTVIVVLTASGLPTAERIAAALPGAEIWGRAGRVETADTFDETVAALRGWFGEGRPIVGLCAAGILIRALAPLLSDKRTEPAVVAVAEDGGAVVPLIGGHAGGANALAREIGAALGVEAAITTGSDVRLGVALDAPPPGWTVSGDVKTVAAHLLAGGGVDLRVEAGDAGWLEGLPRGDGPVVHVTDRLSPTSPVLSAPGGGEGRSGDDVATPSPPRGAERVGVRWGDADVVLHPPTLAIGVGTERGVSPEELRDLVDATLADAGLARESIAALGTLDLKADEAAVLALPWPPRLFDAATLEAETPRLANPSDVVFQAVGCHGVAEAAALALAGPDAELVVAKRKSARATCAVARAPKGLPQPLAGRARGHLAIVGIGPGRADWRTPAATAALRRAEVAIGYGGYLDQVADLIGPARRFELGQERDRVIAALDAAGEGKRVALVCSGDAGIYAMAALAHELLDTEAKPAWRTASVEVVPGVSAAQAAAARAGAPLGHDFCFISLSDLLTPWPAIETRLRAAAAGDFVIALYNPASMTRRQPLDGALAILRAERPAGTPVVVARNVGRPDERISTTKLADLDAASVDMMTCLIIGSSTTRAAPSGVYTPRGYQV